MKRLTQILILLTLGIAGIFLPVQRYTSSHLSALVAAGNYSMLQKADSGQVDNKWQPKVYPPVTPGQPHPDRMVPDRINKKQLAPAPDTSQHQAPPKHKAKLSGEEDPQKR